MIKVENLKFLLRDDKYCRYSEGAFIKLKNGDIMFMCTRFKGERANDNAPADLVRYITKDKGITWSESEPVLKGNDFGVMNIMSLSLIRMKNGDMGILFIAKIVPSWVNYILFSTSADEGKTWSKPVSALPTSYNGKLGVNNARLTRLSSGRLIYPLSLHGGTLPPKYDYPHYSGSSYTIDSAVFSDDEGKIWSLASDFACPPFTGTHSGIQEGCIWEINPGVLKLVWRSDKMYQYESLSFDNGDHWSVPTPSCFTGTCSPIYFIRNDANGKVYALWNPTPNYNRKGPKQSRTPLAIAEVNKDISAFKDFELVENDPICSYAYLSGIFTDEDRLLLAYSSGSTKNIPGGIGNWARMTISSVTFKDEDK